MDHLDFVNTSLRLRYEAFSTFATQVNQANDLENIGEALAAHLKFVLDTFIFRLGATIDQEVYVFELFRGHYTIDTPATLSPFEQQCLTNELPLTLSSSDIQQEPLLQNSRFTHPRVTHLIVLPFYADRQQLILSIASKNSHAYTEIDFRFARLLEEMLSTKISQLLLIRKIASKNVALELANRQLSRLNRKVQNLNADLESKVEERTASLQEAHQELNTLLYRTSHDFRRPLTALIGLAQLLTMHPSREETDQLTQYMVSTVEGLDKMLVKLQMLALTRADEAPELINYVELAKEVEQKFQKELAQNRVKLSYQINQRREYVSLRSVHLAVLENLVENAIRYHQGADPAVRIEVKETLSSLVISVIDNGKGIPKHLQSTVFDMYTKASDHTQGDGLGLFVVKKLVAALNGTIDFSSTFGEGSTFTVQIPYERDEVYVPQRLHATAALSN